MKIVILGKGEMLASLIRGAINSGSEIAGVFRYERTVYPAWKLKLKDFFTTAHELTLIKKYKLYEIKCNSANSEKFKKEILRLNADVVLVGTWPEKLKKEIIDLPVIASINVHPSLLPKYRGPNPYLQNILHGENISGITFHLMDENFDTGAILAQKQIQIFPCDTSKELRERTVFEAGLMCTQLLKKLSQGLIVPVKQDNNKAEYFPNIKPENMMLDFEKETAKEICARIRAFHPWLPCYVTYKNKFFIPNPYNLKIISASAIPGTIIDKDYKTSSITVACLNGKAIKMEKVKLYGLSVFTKLFLYFL